MIEQKFISYDRETEKRALRTKNRGALSYLELLKMFARIELRATAAPETIPAAPAKYIARLVIDAPARESVTTYIYFDADFQGGPMTVNVTDFSAALVYRCLVAGSLRLALKAAARVLDAGKDSIKQRLKVDLNRNLKLGATRWRYDALASIPDFSLTTN